MKKTLFLASAILALATVPALSAPPPQNQPGLPAPKILVINRAAILQYSKVGQDITRQVQGFAVQAKNDMSGQQKALEAEGQQLQQQIAILAPDAKQKRIQAFQAKEAALQGLGQRKEQQVQGAIMKAQQQVEQTLGPILNAIMQQRGGNMILDKQAVVFAQGSFDITNQVIDQLNAKLPSLKVTLAAPGK